MNLRVNLLAVFVLSICSNYALAQFDTIINLPENPVSPNPSEFSGISIDGTFSTPIEILSNTQLNVSDDGSVGDFLNAGASDASSTNIEVNISGGFVGDNFNANSGSTINISGGSVDRFFNANSGSTVNISGGRVLSDFDANSGSTVNISGGIVNGFFDVIDSSVNISGGSVSVVRARSGSNLSISGGTLNLSSTGSTADIT